jgi:hypothetical protein
VSDLEPRKRRTKDVAPRHIPSEVVPLPIGDVREFMHDALQRTNLGNPLVGALSGFIFFRPYVRYVEVDATHTRIELDVVGSPAAEALLFPQRRAEIDRFFVAIHDELDRRARWGPRRLTGGLELE